MNKYSSKAVKTAATVGMSLAMVLSNVAPVVSNLTVAFAADDIITDKQTTEKAHDVVSKVLDALTKDYDKEFNTTEVLDGNVTIVTGTSTVDLTVTDKKLSGMGAATLSADLPGSNFKSGATLKQIAAFLANNSSYMDEADIDEDVITFAKFIKGYDDGVTKLATYFTNGDWEDANNNVIKLVAENGITNNKTDAEKAYKVIKDNEKYLNAVINADGVLDKVNDFIIEVEDYKGENEDAYNKEYVKALEEVILVKATSNTSAINVYDAVEKEVAISYKDLSKVEKVLKDIKNDDVDALSKIADYDDVKDAEEVANYIEGLETIISDMKEVKDLLKSTNTDVKAYKKDLATKVKNLAVAAEALNEDDDDTQTALDKALNAFREADATALKNFVEDFIGSFYTLTPKQLNSGKYVVRLENADYGRYVETTDVFDLLEKDSDETGLQYLLTTVIDNEESEETYYDTVVNTVTTVEELLKAVTTDIDGITMGTTLTDKQASKIVAAKKALNQLVDKNGEIAEEYTKALTTKEKKAVLANVELIDTLYLKLILNGTVTQSGWVDKGNGDWDYIAEDGSRPSKWVASGANWYYVKNGTMLRNSWIASDAQGTRWYYVDDNGVMVSNTTINGYTFNSYGVWVK